MSDLPDESRVSKTGKGSWRPGRKVGRTIYCQAGDEPSDDDPLIGVMDRPEYAMFACISVNLEGSTELLRESAQELVAKYEKLERKLAKQRKRRKEAEAKLAELKVERDELFEGGTEWMNRAKANSTALKRIAAFECASTWKAGMACERLREHEGPYVVCAVCIAREALHREGE